MTILAAIVLRVFPDGGGFVSARAKGFEDIPAAAGVDRLTEHALQLPGHYWAQLSRLVQALLRGTGIGRWGWRYTEEARNVREMFIDPTTGEAVTTEAVVMKHTWDDPHFKCIDSRDFYPDHGEELISEMSGCAEHFRISGANTLRMLESGIYTEKEAVEEALQQGANDAREADAKRSEDVTDVSPQLRSHPDFLKMHAYEFVGETPFRGASDEFSDEDGIARRIITVINGRTVRSRPWPRRMPFSEVKIIPRLGSFWGMGIGELVRHDQDFADTAKSMLADATVRSAHPPMIYDRTQNVELRALKRFHPKVPIGADSISAAQTLNYNPNLGGMFAMYSGVKGQMRDASSALDSLQGQAGPDREAATVGAQRFQAAQSRPELYANILEREWLPSDGRIVIELYQEFLDPANPEEMMARIGQSAGPFSLADIINVDWDLKLIGSRKENSKQRRLEAFREMVAASGNPVVAAANPWIPLLRKWYQDLGEKELAAMVANPQMIELHTMLTQLGGGQPNVNQRPTAAAPSGLMPAQTSGVGA